MFDFYHVPQVKNPFSPGFILGVPHHPALDGLGLALEPVLGALVLDRRFFDVQAQVFIADGSGY